MFQTLCSLFPPHSINIILYFNLHEQSASIFYESANYRKQVENLRMIVLGLLKQVYGTVKKLLP
jgi:hypothetical protein